MKNTKNTKTKTASRARTASTAIGYVLLTSSSLVLVLLGWVMYDLVTPGLPIVVKSNMENLGPKERYHAYLTAWKDSCKFTDPANMLLLYFFAIYISQLIGSTDLLTATGATKDDKDELWSAKRHQNIQLIIFGLDVFTVMLLTFLSIVWGYNYMFESVLLTFTLAIRLVFILVVKAFIKELIRDGKKIVRKIPMGRDHILNLPVIKPPKKATVVVV